MAQKQNKLTQTGIVALLACVCCILWGSAIPVIKTGYHLLQVDSSDTASQIVFAGIRFTLAGILVLIFALQFLSCFFFHLKIPFLLSLEGLLYYFRQGL